jgi:F-type H+-transporting ATPase subunit gamma
MQVLQKLKDELQANLDLTDIVDVLKGIAISEYWALEKRKERFAKFMDAFEGFFHLIDFSTIQHPFAKARGNLGIIMITSDEGFMGGLNTRVINTALGLPGADKAELMMIGERGAADLKALGRNFVSFPGIASEECYEEAMEFKDYIVKESLAGKFGRLILIYPQPISFMVQKVEIVKILPCTELFEKREDLVEMEKDVILESSLHLIIEYLVETWIAQKLLEVFEDSKLAEFSSRTVHLEESYQILLEKGKGIKHQYFRGRHELIDKGMRDIFSAKIVRARAHRKKQKADDKPQISESGL